MCIFVVELTVVDGAGLIPHISSRTGVPSLTKNSFFKLKKKLKLNIQTMDEQYRILMSFMGD